MKEGNFVSKRRTQKMIILIALLVFICAGILIYSEFSNRFSIGAENPEVILQGKLEKYINFKESEDDKGTVVQYNIQAEIKQESEQYTPIKESELIVSLNQIDGKYPHSVKVIGKRTEATNGKSQDIKENYQYDAANGKVTIKASNVNESGDPINSSKPSENTKDEYLVIGYYDTYIQEVQERELSVNIAVNASFFEEDVVVNKEELYKETVKENIGELSSISYNEFAIPNGYIKSNIINKTEYSTIYTEKQNITISKKDIQDKIKILENSTFVKITKNENNEEVIEKIENNKQLVYKSTKIRKENIIKLLGEDGILQIFDNSENLVATIDKNTQFGEDGSLVINYENEPEGIIIKTSKIKNEGILEFENTKEIKSTMLDSDVEINITSKLVGINEKIEIVNEEEVKTEEEIFVNNYEKIVNINDVETNVIMKLNNTQWTNKQQNEIIFDVYVNSNTANSNMLKNPSIRIELPKEVEKVILGSSSSIYTNGLELQNPYLETNENGNTVIVANLLGEQKQYEENTLGLETNVKIPATIILKKDIENTDEKVNLTFTNYYTLDGLAEIRTIEKDIQIESYKEEKVVNNEETIALFANRTSAKATTEELEGLKLEVAPVKGNTAIKNGDAVYEGEFIKYNIKVTNTTDKEIKNVKVVGTIPEGLIYGELEADYNNYMGQYKYNFNEELREKTIEIGTLKAGDVFNTFYEVKVNDLPEGEAEKNILTNIKTFVSETEANTYELNNVIKLSEAEIFLGAFLDNSADRWNYSLKIESEETKEVTVKIIFPKAYKLDLRVQAGGLSGKPNRELKTDENNVLIDTIETNKEYWYQGKMDSKIVRESNDQGPVTLITTASTEIDGVTYNSNENRIEYEFQSVSVTMTSDNEGETVKYEDEINYEIVVKNTGKTNLNQDEVDIIVSDIIDYLPEELEPVSLEYEYWEISEGEWTKKEKTKDLGSRYTDTEGNKLPDVDLTINIPYGETVEIKIKTTAGFVLEKTKIENSVTVSGSEINTKVSNTITHTILPDDYEEEIPGEEPSNPNDPSNPEDPSNPSDPSNPEQPENPDEETKKYSIEGTAWMDRNKDGKRQEDEEKLSNIEVVLVNVENSKIILDGIKTDANGKYKIENIEKGKYIILFKYDTQVYRVTEYKKQGVANALNSDATKKEVRINGQTFIVGATDIINLEESCSNIDIGLIKNEICDLKLDKYVSSIAVSTSKGTSQYSYNNQKLAKVEIRAKEIEGATVVVEYKIVVTNEGELPATAGKIIDYIPEGMIFSSELNKNWGTQKDGQLINTSLANTIINPGEAKELKLVLTKKMNSNSTGEFINIAEIADISNALGILDTDSTPGNNVQSEDDYSKASVIITISTGGIVLVGLIITITCVLMVVLIVLSKKGLLKNVNNASKIILILLILVAAISVRDSALAEVSISDGINIIEELKTLYFDYIENPGEYFNEEDIDKHMNYYGSVCFLGDYEYTNEEGKRVKVEAHCQNAGLNAYTGTYYFKEATSVIPISSETTASSISLTKKDYKNGVDIIENGETLLLGPISFEQKLTNAESKNVYYKISLQTSGGDMIIPTEICRKDGTKLYEFYEEYTGDRGVTPNGGLNGGKPEKFYLKIPKDTERIIKINLLARLAGEDTTIDTETVLAGYLTYKSTEFGESEDQEVKTEDRIPYAVTTEKVNVMVYDSVDWTTINTWVGLEKEDYDDENIKLSNVGFTLRRNVIANGPTQYEYLKLDEEEYSRNKGSITINSYDDQTWVDNKEDATTFYTNHNGSLIIKNLAPKYTYKFIETVNNNYGYDINNVIYNNNEYSTGERSIKPGERYIFPIQNKKQTGNLQIIKRDADTSELLEGVKFKIRKQFPTSEYDQYVQILGKGQELKGKVVIDTGMRFTTEDYATTFITNSRGRIQIINMLAGEYVIEEIGVGPDYILDKDHVTWEYEKLNEDGTKTLVTKNDISIAYEVIRQSSKETDKNNTNYKFENNITVYNQKEGINISGYVWNDHYEGKASNRDNLYNSSGGKDKKLSGITVRLKNKSTGEIVIDKDGKAMEKTIQDGTYKFEDVPRNELENYYIEFEYDGLIYTNVTKIDSPNGTKAVEKASDRTTLDREFSKIEGKTKDTGITRDSGGNEKHTLKYNLESEGSNEIKAVFNQVDGGNPTIKADTSTAGYDLKTLYDSGDTNYRDGNNLININLGLYTREQPDIKITKDLQNIKMSINNYTQVYGYGVKEKNENISSYNREIYVADYLYNDGMTGEGSRNLKVYLTYRIKMENETTGLKVRVNSIIDYFDENYELVKIGTELEDGEVKENNITHGTVVQEYKTINGTKYSKVIINNNTNIAEKQDGIIYVQFKLKNDRIAGLINSQKSLYNVAEINSYSVFSESGHTYAGIDKDSNPGNAMLDNNKIRLEDDTSVAPGLKVKGLQRTLSGKVFLDESTGGIGVERFGNGELGKDREKNGEFVEEEGIKDVKVELIETTGTGEKYTTTTNDSGLFTINGYIPGKYIVKYTWGNQTYTEDTGILINANDYKGTIYKDKYRSMNLTWHKTEDPRYSDAMDDYEIRKAIDSNTKNEMESNTPNFEVTLEMDGNLLETVENVYGFNTKIYKINYIDFGIVERARQEIDVEKRVESVEIILANGQKIASFEYDADGNPVKSGALADIPGTITNNDILKAEIDQELIQGSTAKITYGIYFKNNSEIDYDDKYYYLYGEPKPSDDKIIRYIPKNIYDYLDEELVSQDTNWDVHTVENYHGKVGSKTITEEYLYNNRSKTLPPDDYIGYENFSDDYKEAINNNWNDTYVKNARKKRLSGKTILWYNQIENEVIQNKLNGIKPGDGSTCISTLTVSKLLTNLNEIDFNNDAEITNAERIGTTGRKLTLKSLCDKAESLVVTTPTGDNKNYTLIIGITISLLVTIATGIIFIKKKILR